MGVVDKAGGAADKVAEGAGKVVEGAGTVARSAQKVVRHGIDKVEEYQVVRQMDGVARKLGYAEFEASKSQHVDVATRKALLAEMATLEDQLEQMRAARAERTADTTEASPAETASEVTPSGAESSGAAPESDSAPGTAGD